MLELCRKPGLEVVPSELCCGAHLLPPEVKGGDIDQASLAAFAGQVSLAGSAGALLGPHTSSHWM